MRPSAPLLKRLKRRAPGIPVLVGLRPVGEKVLTDAAIGREVGADFYVSSLRDGVEACLKAADATGRDPAVPSGRRAFGVVQ